MTSRTANSYSDQTNPDDKSQIEEYLHVYKGEGNPRTSRSARTTSTRTVERWRRAVCVGHVPDTIYERPRHRNQSHGEETSNAAEAQPQS